MATKSVKQVTIRDSIKWQVDYREEGKRRRRVFADQASAEKFAQKVKGGNVVLVGADKTDYLAAKQILAGVPLVEAASFWASNHRASVSKKLLAAALECDEAKRKSGKAEHYLRTFTGRTKDLARYLLDKPCHEVTHLEIQSWLHDREDWKPVTKMGALRDARTFFGFAIRQGWCVKNPANAVENIEVGEFAKEILTPDQAKVFIRAIAEIDPKLVRYFVDQLFGGLREDEAKLLTKECVKSNFLEFDRKTGEMGFVEFNPTWLAWRNKFKGDHCPIPGWRNRIIKARMFARRKLVESNLVSEDWWFPRNCLRHSFATYSAKLWGPGRAADLAGHSEATQKKHYRRPISLAEAKSFWAILPK